MELLECEQAKWELEKAWKTAQLKTFLNFQNKEQKNFEFLAFHFFENSEGTVFNLDVSIFSPNHNKKQFGCSFVLDKYSQLYFLV